MAIIMHLPAQIEINHKIAIGAISYLNGYYYVETLKS
jgi:hypothetical protein